jgi:hypothetical protein
VTLSLRGWHRPVDRRRVLDAERSASPWWLRTWSSRSSRSTAGSPGRRRGAVGARGRIVGPGRRGMTGSAPGAARHRDQGTLVGVAAGSGHLADGVGGLLVALGLEAGIADMGPGREGLRRRAEAPSVPVTCLPRSQSSPVMWRPVDMPSPVTRETGRASSSTTDGSHRGRAPAVAGCRAAVEAELLGAGDPVTGQVERAGDAAPLLVTVAGHASGALAGCLGGAGGDWTLNRCQGWVPSRGWG